MKNRAYVALLLGSSVLGVVGIAGQAAAQAAAADNSIETVVVTADKRSELIKNVPMSMSVLGQDQLNLLNSRSFEDYVANVPGLSLTEGDPSHPTLILRGINAGGDGATVGTYLDETPYGSSNALANGVDTAPNLDTYDMQRLEVLRGPQGTLYGANAMGGILKFVSNAPDPGAFADSFELGAVDMDHGGTEAFLRGMVNIPITDDLAVRAVGFYAKTPGYIDDPALNEKGTNSELSDGGRLSALWTPTSKLSIRVNASMQQLDDGNSDSEDIVLVPGGSFYPKYGNYQQERTTNEPSGVRYYVFNTTVNYDFDWATLTSSTSFNLLHDFTLEDASGVYGADVQGFLHQAKFTQEVRLASDPGQGPIDWLAGFYYTNEISSLHQDIVPSFHGTPLGSLQLDSRYDEIAGFANGTYHITDRLSIGVGGRYTSNSQSADEFGLASANGGSTGSVFTWSADLGYKLDDDTNLYARAASGYQPGGPNDLPPGAPKGVPATYSASTLTSYEVGVKSSLINSRLSFDADIFYIDWNNIQLLTVVDNYGVNNNGGTARSDGAEVSANWTPIDGLAINLSGAYTDAVLTSNTDPIYVGGVKGDWLPYAPKWSSALSGDYNFASIGDWTPFIGATWHYIGERQSGFTPYADVLEGVMAANVYEHQYALPAYSTIELRAGINWTKWSLEVYAKNLTDAKGIEGFGDYSTSAANGLAPNVSLIAPRLVGIVLRGSF
jgi:outer membrane receptor protein involved in Fe transport